MASMKWNHRMLGLARHVASWSKDPSTKVGAVLADEHNRVISLGFNGPPRGADDSPTSRDRKLRRTIHAENNAILFAQRDLTGTTLYCTHHPCGACAAMIAQAGISRVVAPSDGLLGSRWDSDVVEAKNTFKDTGIEFLEIVSQPEQPLED